MSAFETAREFAEHGMPVFPTHTVIDGRCSCGRPDCGSPGKHPRTRNGLKDASAEERTLRQWNESWPDSNWAVACGESFSVVDIDSKAGADPKEIIAEYELTGPIVWTGEAADGELSGVRGAHVYLANGVVTGRTAVEGVEMRATGAYVLLPGSRHVSGVAYEWVDHLRPWSVDLAPVPDALVPRRTGSGSAPQLAPGAPVPHHARHDHLEDFAVRLVRAGVTDQQTLTAHLWTEFRERCEADPEPEPGSIEALAKWAAGTKIAERERQGASIAAPVAVGWREAKNGRREVVLPDLPDAGNVPALCAWLTAVFGLDLAHPITGGERTGTHDAEGTAVLRRRGAPEIRFAPFTRLCAPTKLLETLNACMVPSDGVAPPLKGEHCPIVTAAVRRLCDSTACVTVAERAIGIVATFVQDAVAVHGHTTYGTTSGQRYAAASALSRQRDDYGRPTGWPSYLVDSNTGELVIRVSDLQIAARAHEGSGLRRGELDELMHEVGWTSFRLDGHQLPGRAGKTGPHLKTRVWRGLLVDAAEDSVDP